LPEDEDYLRDLGVSEILERDADIAALMRERHPDGIDALLDLVSYNLPNASTPTPQHSSQAVEALHRTQRPAKNRGATTSWRCRARRTWSAWANYWTRAP
jgi:hypothetical protein